MATTKPKAIKVTLTGKPAASTQGTSETAATVREVKRKRAVAERIAAPTSKVVDSKQRAATSTRVSERLGTVATTGMASSLKARLGSKQSERRPQGQSDERKERTRIRTTSVPRRRSGTSMVADEYETKRQMDIRSRLEKRESEKAARRRGPLSGRLGQHHVFGRLE